MTEIKLLTCKYCLRPVNSKKLSSHIKNRCPKSPEAEKLKNKLSASPDIFKMPLTNIKKIRLKVRLKRLFSELNSKHIEVDDKELANLFNAFYLMYVMDNKKPHHKQDEDKSESIWTVSGGLPSLGKGAK